MRFLSFLTIFSRSVLRVCTFYTYICSYYVYYIAIAINSCAIFKMRIEMLLLFFSIFFFSFNFSLAWRCIVFVFHPFKNYALCIFDWLCKRAVVGGLFYVWNLTNNNGIQSVPVFLLCFSFWRVSFSDVSICGYYRTQFSRMVAGWLVFDARCLSLQCACRLCSMPGHQNTWNPIS